MTVGAGDSSPVIFYFHGYSLMLASENRSIFVFDRADLDPPMDEHATFIECASELRQVVEGVPCWVGGVSWGSRLSNYTRIGRVTIYCWLSSEEWLWFWEASGVGVGVAEVDGKGNVVWGPSYHYKYSLGNMLSSAPSEHSLTVDVNHVFRPGNHVLFGVVIGSTRQGWTAKVCFGSVDYPSRAIVQFEEGS